MDVKLSLKIQMSERRSIRAVVERFEHHCGDDLAQLARDKIKRTHRREYEWYLSRLIAAISMMFLSYLSR